MEQKEEFKKLMKVFKTGKLTPKEFGHLMRVYYEKYNGEGAKSSLNDVFDGRLAQ